MRFGLFLLAVVVSGFLNDSPRWVLAFLLIPFGAIGLWAFRYFLNSLKQTAGVGATIVEISSLPLHPGHSYDLYVRQAGRLDLRRLRVELICEEETMFRQGTDVRIDRHVAMSKILTTNAMLGLTHSALGNKNYSSICQRALCTHFEVLITRSAENNSEWRCSSVAIVLPKLPRVRASSRASLGATPSLTIELCRPDRRYAAGQPIAIQWHLQHSDLSLLDRVELSVLWQTEGKGDEDLHVHHFQSWNESQLKQTDMCEPQSLRCTLPSSPLTYDGTLLRIRWFVRLRVYQTDGRDFHSQVPFRLSGLEVIETLSD